MKKVIGYCRVSTNKQDTNRQKLDIVDYIKEKCLGSYEIREEKISSQKKDREIYQLINELKENDVLIITEFSRLARSMVELNGIVSKILEKKAHLHVIEKKMIVDDSIGSQSLVFAFGISAQIERELISSRIKSALSAKKKEGVKLGRPKGKGKKLEDACKNVDMKIEQVHKLLKMGISYRKIAQILNIDSRTVKEWSKNNGY